MDFKMLILPAIIFCFISLASTDKACPHKPTDIIFVLDGSGSEGVVNFRKQLEFVSNITEQFEIGQNLTRVSLVTFGTKVYNQFYLNEITDKTDALTRINATPYPNGETMTHAALNFVEYTTLQSLYGGDRNVTKIVIVLTDGRSVEPQLTQIAASFLKNEPLVTVFAIGIGSNVDSHELAYIASDRHHIFQVESFDLLHSLQSEVTDTACNICKEASIDVCFVLDSSGSEGADNFAKQLTFINMLINDFSFDGAYTSRVCVITFSTGSQTEIHLDQYTDKHALISSINNIPYRTGETMTHLGLREAINEFNLFTANNKIAIVLTDGHSTEPEYTEYQSHELQRAGVDVYAVGIRDRVDGRELHVIASANDHVFRVDNFDKLNDLHDVFASQLCNTVIKTTVPTSSTTTSPHVSTVHTTSTESSTKPLISSKPTPIISTSTPGSTSSPPLPTLFTTRPTVVSTESSSNLPASSTSTSKSTTSSVLPTLFTPRPTVVSTESSTKLQVTISSSPATSKSTSGTSTPIASTSASNTPTITSTNAPVTSTLAPTTSVTPSVPPTIATQTPGTSTFVPTTLPDVSATSSSVKTSPTVTLLPSSSSSVSRFTAQPDSTSSTIPSTIGTTTELIVSATSIQTTVSRSNK